MEIITNIVDVIANYDYSNAIFVWEAIAFPICVLLLCGIIYSVSKTIKIHKARHEALLRGGKESSVFGAPVDKSKNVSEWVLILAKAKSEDENERKFAIIAADSLVEKILALAGYEGENLGERLKKIEVSDLDSLNDVWEAHKV